MSLTAKYPNLELLEYIAKQMFNKDESIKKKLEEIRKNNRYAVIEFETEVFPQLWGSTCTGFDETEDGDLVMSGCAMTKAYTCVFHELLTDIYIVFFDDRPCYMVKNANQVFREDLKNRNLCGLHDAKLRY